MKKLLLLLGIVTVFTAFSNHKLTVENVYEVILDEDIQAPKYVLAQSALETAWYRSYNCKARNNLFGFRSSSWATEGNPNGYKIFTSWQESVEYYSYWQERKGYRKGEDYIQFLKRVGYAEDPEYGWKVKSVLKRIETKYGI